MRHQVSEKIGPWVNEAIDRHHDGSPILWEPGLVPKSGGVVVACVFWFPGTTLGTVQQGSFAITNPLTVSKDEIDQTVEDFLRAMREAQGRELDDTVAAQPQTPSGPQAPVEPPVPGQRRASGLIIAR